MDVTNILQKWYALHKRDLPWRETSSPYFIWLSEIILQQTRVRQGLEFYLRFTGQYPRIEDLACAPLDEVLKLWQGLGYYTRARNLHATAKFIVTELKGVFPASYDELIRLKGIGKYTAAAIASLAFREPVAVVDGNVLRVISRLYGIDHSIDQASGKAMCNHLASKILDRKNPDIHNQAIMDFGALICLPRNPLCKDCPLSSRCLALKMGKTNLLPLRSGKKTQRIRYFNYLYIKSRDFTWLHKRNNRDIWNSLYELPLIETPGPASLQELSALKAWKDILGTAKVEPVGVARHLKHQLTHQLIHCDFYQLEVKGEPSFTGWPVIRIRTDDLSQYAVPRLIEKYLGDPGQ
jgi:A/G-specific adenine glycosylase